MTRKPRYAIYENAQLRLVAEAHQYMAATTPMSHALKASASDVIHLDNFEDFCVALKNYVHTPAITLIHTAEQLDRLQTWMLIAEKDQGFKIDDPAGPKFRSYNA